MLEKAYLAIFVIVVVAQFFKPVLGIMGIILICTLKTYFIFPVHNEYRLTLVLGIAALLSAAFHGFKGKNTDVFSLIFGFMFLCLLSTILNGNFETLRFLFELFKTLGIALLILSIKIKKNDLVLLLVTIVSAGAANAAYALVQQVANINVENYRSVGFADQPNATAMYIYMSVPLAWYFYAHAKSKLLKIFFIAALTIMILGVIATASRSGMLAIALIGFLLFVKHIKRPLTLILIIVAFYFTADLVKDKFSERKIIRHSFSKGDTIDGSVMLRVNAAKGAVMLWLWNPVFGVGPGNFANARAKKLGLKGLDAGLSVHNTLLQVAAETGTIGLILFCAIILKGFKALNRAVEEGDTFFKELAENGKIFLMVLCFGTLFTNVFATEIYWVWMMIPFVVRGVCFGTTEASPLPQTIHA